MKKIICLLLLVVGCSSGQKKEKSVEASALLTPKVAFEVVEGIAHPESVFYSHSHSAFFVPNIASGNPVEPKKLGYLSKVSADGKTVNPRWVKGLRAPKGIVVVGNNLYVTDVDKVVRVDIKRARIVQSYPARGSEFLNDLAADEKGNVYVTDMFSNIMYRIEKNRLSVWLKDDRIYGANGLANAGNEHLLIGRWGNDIDPKAFGTSSAGDIVSVSFKDPSQMTINKKITGHFDGLAIDGKGNTWISDWMDGDIYKMNKVGEAKKIYNFGQGTADISYAKELNLLVIPQMNQSELIFVEL